jgi:hypothetical protein
VMIPPAESPFATRITLSLLPNQNLPHILNRHP